MSMALDASKLELRRLSGRAASGRQPRFSLPRVFPPEARTLELYAEFAGDVVASSVDGYHGSIFACAWRCGSGGIRWHCPSTPAPLRRIRRPDLDGEDLYHAGYAAGPRRHPARRARRVPAHPRLRGPRVPAPHLLPRGLQRVRQRPPQPRRHQPEAGGGPAARCALQPPILHDRCSRRRALTRCAQAAWCKACARRWWRPPPRSSRTSASASRIGTSAPPTTTSSPPARTPYSAWW